MDSLLLPYIILTLILMIAMYKYACGFPINKKNSFTILTDKGAVTMGKRQFVKHVAQVNSALYDVAYFPENEAEDIKEIANKSIEEIKRFLPAREPFDFNAEDHKVVLEAHGDEPFLTPSRVGELRIFLTRLTCYPNASPIDFRGIDYLTKRFYKSKKKRLMKPIIKRPDKLASVEEIKYDEQKGNLNGKHFKGALESSISKPLDGFVENKSARPPMLFNQPEFVEADIPFVFERMRNPKPQYKFTRGVRRYFTRSEKYDKSGKTKLAPY